MLIYRRRIGWSFDAIVHVHVIQESMTRTDKSIEVVSVNMIS